MGSTKEFSGKTAIVTGAGQGIGFEICRQLSEKGANIVLNDIDASLAKLAAKELNESRPGTVTAVEGDCSDPQIIQQLVVTAVQRYGELHIAIANAGITLYGDFFTYSPADLEKVMHVNLGGSFFLAQAAANQIRKQQTGGSILLMSSVTGHQAHKNLAAYGMTKAALEMLAKNLVIELSQFGITINALAPGATLTERTITDKAYQATWSSITPMGRPAHVDDIAAAASFLVSGKARHITGQSLVIDGGWTSVSPSPYQQ